jgi:hypothetical protein
MDPDPRILGNGSGKKYTDPDPQHCKKNLLYACLVWSYIYPYKYDPIEKKSTVEDAQQCGI